MRLSDVEKELEKYRASGQKFLPYKVALLSDYTIDPVVPYLQYECYREGIKCEVYIGEFDNIMQELEGEEYKNFKPDVTVIAMKEPSEIVWTYAEKALGRILLHSFQHIPYRVGEILSKGIGEVTAEARPVGNTYLVDMDKITSRIGYANLIDKRMWHFAKIPYTASGWEAIAGEYIRFIRAFTGKVRKCLVLDCDNTLWGGILGEDRFNGIKIGTDYPGSCYREFQQTIKSFKEKNVLLAMCSRNNESDVLEVLEKHPDMVLGQEDFVNIKVNWNDKVTSIEEIAEELNIGVDSLVFMDDNPFEIEMVKRMLPQVTAILLDSQHPESYTDVLLSCGYFDALSTTEEDSKRSEMYKVEVARKKAQKGMPLDEYLKWLEMEVEIGKADDFTVPRVAQLTQRTNQFNLTTKRYTEEEIKRLVAEGADVLWCRLKDRLGDIGIIGVAIVAYPDSQRAYIDSFLVSCRALGRGVEDTLLKACIKVAFSIGRTSITGEFIPTDKNYQVKEFYHHHKFKASGDGKYILNKTSRDSYKNPDWFKKIKYLFAEVEK